MRMATTSPGSGREELLNRTMLSVRRMQVTFKRLTRRRRKDARKVSRSKVQVTLASLVARRGRAEGRDACRRLRKVAGGPGKHCRTAQSTDQIPTYGMTSEITQKVGHVPKLAVSSELIRISHWPVRATPAPIQRVLAFETRLAPPDSSFCFMKQRES